MKSCPGNSEVIGDWSHRFICAESGEDGVRRIGIQIQLFSQRVRAVKPFCLEMIPEQIGVVISAIPSFAS